MIVGFAHLDAHQRELYQRWWWVSARSYVVQYAISVSCFQVLDPWPSATRRWILDDRSDTRILPFASRLLSWQIEGNAVYQIIYVAKYRIPYLEIHAALYRLLTASTLAPLISCPSIGMPSGMR